MSNISVGIIYKRKFKPAKVEAQKLEKWLNKKGISVYSEANISDAPNDSFGKESSVSPDLLDWVVVLGGDGTLLGAARKVGRYGVPILGVNLGGLGFLTGIPLQRLYPAIEMLFEDKLEMESRLMLEAKVIREEREVGQFNFLNDVVINKRIIELDVFINKLFLTTFKADGLIISTPTGSTAYNLAAGGPILYPTMANIILTPICPFTLTNRPIILPDSNAISIMMKKESEESVNLTIDGQVGFDLHYGDKVTIRKSEKRIKLLRWPGQNYFEILRTKLMWGGTTYNSNGDN
ncbi:NAD(+)/NADH kinase [Thermodesulfobacteriota bacterium]